ncbi:hypothetical protein TRAPUB_6641 [Trametes pubescens]|uniref:Mitochondrial distribution and morphology protein 35 n=1 Tax=Trametes pubescens TaxID=154538 RepID=A0A1M2V593_TRAPU|nr:hypothetical protein TRAPUB_6641 [Trametes pubescens]
MSQSLNNECTPLKREYDACFNAWFEGYLEPALSSAANAEQRTKFAQQKAAEFESSCGKVWQEYRKCVQPVHFGGLVLWGGGVDVHLSPARPEKPPVVEGLDYSQPRANRGL